MRCLALLLLGLVTLASRGDEPAAGLLPWSGNSWYWSYRGEPVLLLGGSDDDNLFQWPADALVAQLDRLVAAGGNVIRNTMSDRRDKGFEVYPFLRLKDGRYDLSRWNEEYWARLDRMLLETARRRIFVQIEIWDRFDFSDNKAPHWQTHPYQPSNNVNYIEAESGLGPRYPEHPARNRHPFFFTTPAQRDLAVVRTYQDRFVHRLLDSTLRHDHVLYCIDNETSADPAWGRYWAELVKARAARSGRIVMVTEMWDDWDLRTDQHKQTFDHPELYDFVDVSQNTHVSHRSQWERFLQARAYLAERPRPMNTTKVYGADGNAFGDSDQDAIARFWRHLLAGAASVRFHRPDAGIGLNDKAVACIRAARKLESQIPLWTVEPADALLTDCDPDEAYAAARSGESFVLYFPSAGDITLDLGRAEGEFVLRWIEVATGEWRGMERRAGGGPARVRTPGPGNWVASITRASP